MPQIAMEERGSRIGAHISIMRLDHSIKNIFVLPGIVIPLVVTRTWPDGKLWLRILLGFVSCTLIACSNYVINEVLDAPFDRLHPIKRNRPAACGLVNTPLAIVQWIAMMAAGLAIGLQVSKEFTLVAAVLWIMGCLYNIRPFRTKDVPYLDVTTESINNPLRMLLGWYMVTSTLVPPLSLLVAYWMLGCYFMALKRLSEYREIDDAAVAGAYRRSFQHYTERKLLKSILFYASFAMLMYGFFIARYRFELVLSLPLVALLMSTYFDLTFKEHSAVQNPEKLYREPRLMIELLITTVAILLLLWFNIPWIRTLFTSSNLGG